MSESEESGKWLPWILDLALVSDSARFDLFRKEECVSLLKNQGGKICVCGQSLDDNMEEEN